MFHASSAAFQINSVQHLKVILENDDLSVDVTLQDAVNPENSILTFTSKIKLLGANENAGYLAPIFVDRRTVRIIRQMRGSSLEVALSVTEFKSGVKVSRGVTLFPKEVFQKIITIPRVEHQSAVVFLHPTTSELTPGEGAHLLFIPSFNDASNLSIKRSLGNEIKKREDADAESESFTEVDKNQKKKEIPRMPMPEVSVYWQVVEFLEGVKVMQGTAKIPHFSKDTNAYLPEPVLAEEHSLIFFNWTADSNTYGKKYLSTLTSNFTNKSVMLFSRPGKGAHRLAGLDIQWSVLQLPSKSSFVQSGIAHIRQNEIERDIPIKTVEKDRALVFLETSGGDLSDALSETQQSAALHFSGELINSETLRVSRGDSTWLTADVKWSVVQFSPVTLTQPSGDEVWTVGSKHKITWSYAREFGKISKKYAKVQSVDIQLSMNQGVDAFPYFLATDIPVTAQSYEWIIPEELNETSVIGKGLQVRLCLHGQKESLDVSQKPFEIRGTLKLLQPRGKEVWHVGDEGHEIKWEYNGKIGVLAIYYDLKSGFGSNPFPSTQRIARVVPGKNGVGSYTWSPIPDLSSTRVRLKIVSEADKTVADINEDDFTILPKITMTAPKGGADSFDAEKHQIIKWDSSGTINSLNLYYRLAESENWILSVKDIPNGEGALHAYRWFVPAEAVSDTLQIKLEKVGSPEVFVYAPVDGQGFFSVKSWIRLLQPSGDVETWRVNEKREIQWKVGGNIPYMNFEYSTDAGVTWTKEAVLRAADKKFAWTVPDIQTEQFLIRLSDVKSNATNIHAEAQVRIVGEADPHETQADKQADWWRKTV